jgi:hypothetical protein
VAPGCLTLAASSAGESLEVCSEEGGQDAEGGPSPHSHLQLPGTTRPHTIHTLSIWSRALSKLAGWSPVALSIAAPGSVAGAEWGPLAGAQQVRTAGQDQRLPKATRNASAGPCEMPKKQLGVGRGRGTVAATPSATLGGLPAGAYDPAGRSDLLEFG